MGRSAARLAEYRGREAVGAPPLKWSVRAALAHCHSWNTLGVENAMQVGAHPRNEFFDVGALRLKHVSNGAKEGHEDKLTLFFFSGIIGSSIQGVSSTSIDRGAVSCNVSTFFIWPAS